MCHTAFSSSKLQFWDKSVLSSMGVQVIINAGFCFSSAGAAGCFAIRYLTAAVFSFFPLSFPLFKLLLKGHFYEKRDITCIVTLKFTEPESNSVRITAASLTPHYDFCCALRLSSLPLQFRAVGVESLFWGDNDKRTATESDIVLSRQFSLPVNSTHPW